MDAKCLFGKFPWEMFNSIFLHKQLKFVTSRETHKGETFLHFSRGKSIPTIQFLKLLKELYFLKTAFENIQFY